MSKDDESYDKTLKELRETQLKRERILLEKELYKQALFTKATTFFKNIYTLKFITNEALSAGKKFFIFTIFATFLAITAALTISLYSSYKSDKYIETDCLLFNKSCTSKASSDTVTYTQIKPIIEQRCVMCHGEALQSKNIRLDSFEYVNKHAQTIHQQVVVNKLMPLNNATNITDAERVLFAQWFQGISGSGTN
jgi:uncharacterized membrane protein